MKRLQSKMPPIPHLISNFGSNSRGGLLDLFVFLLLCSVSLISDHFSLSLLADLKRGVNGGREEEGLTVWGPLLMTAFSPYAGATGATTTGAVISSYNQEYPSILPYSFHLPYLDGSDNSSRAHRGDIWSSSDLLSSSDGSRGTDVVWSSLLLVRENRGSLNRRKIEGGRRGRKEYLVWSTSNLLSSNDGRRSNLISSSYSSSNGTTGGGIGSTSKWCTREAMRRKR